MKLHTKKIVFVAFLASVVSALVSTVLLYKSLADKPQASISSIRERLESHTPTNPEKSEFNILLLGFGGAGHPGGGLSDAMILANVNTASKRVNLVAIPRDIWVDNFKINSAYTVSVAATKSAVEKVTGLPVDFYAAVDFFRFAKTIDLLGGINVDVPVAFDDYFYPVQGLENELCGMTPERMEEVHRLYSGFELEKQFTCRYEHLRFDSGRQNMAGATALKFIRSRHSNAHGGDFARGVRQQAVLIAIKNKLISLDAVSKIDELFEQLRHMIVSDIGEEDVIDLLSRIGNPSEYTSLNINISTDNYLQNSTSPDGQYILIPKAGNGNWQAVHNYINNELK